MDRCSNNPSVSNNSTSGSNLSEDNATKLISAITDFIPTFFSSNGILLKENEKKEHPNVWEILIQSEEFFKDHPNTFKDDEYKSSFVINKLRGTARRWGLSLLTDGTLKKLSYEQFKKLLLENFDSGNEIKQKYVIMDKLWKLKQNQLGSAADYTIEFRRLAARLGWPDEVLIDIIGRGLINKVREEFDKQEKPTTLFEASNIIIGIDKKCYLENCLRDNSNRIHKNNKSFNRKRHELNRTENHFKSEHNKKNKLKNDIFSANYTPNSKSTITTTFYLSTNGRKMKANFLIDSESARSFLCKNLYC